MLGGVKNSNQAKAPQAQWNVQVVRGKVTTRCLWNACKALSIGLLLLTIGTTMAVIGYYADQLSIRSETRGNFTVKIKNESRGFHLNNLSYAGPIVMGIGGFIVVAACVMTFEARDSAAKVVPARFKPNLNTSITSESTKTTPRTSRTFQRMESKRNSSVQTPAGGKCSGLYKLDSTGTGNCCPPKPDLLGKKAFTAAFAQFSRELLENSTLEGNRRWKRKISEVNLNKSPSAPDLAVEEPASESLNQESKSNANGRLCKGSPKTSSRSQRESVCPLGANVCSNHDLFSFQTISSNLLLRPSHLQRQALSMDNPFYESYECCTPSSVRTLRQQSKRSRGSRESFEMELGSSAGVSGSQTSMALDLHDCQVTLKVKDESANKRSDTARRHQLLRQKPVEDDVIPRCSCIPRFLCASAVEEFSIRTKSSMNLKSLCHHCLRASGSCSGRSHIPNINPDFRSQSFSHTNVNGDPKKCTFHEDNHKIFCIDNLRRANHSSENVKLYCEEKHRCPRKHSPCISPHRSPRSECRVQRLEGSECLLHRTKDILASHPLAKDGARKKRANPKIEGSLSAEEQNFRSRKAGRFRSASFSPTRKASPTTPTPSRDGSSSPGKQSSSSVSGALEGTKAGEKPNEKTELEEPS